MFKLLFYKQSENFKCNQVRNVVSFGIFATGVIIMYKKMKENEFKFLLTFYNATQSEITRYRDREWAIPGIFVTALVSIVGFIIINEQKVRHLWFAFDTLLILLAVGNAYFTIYTHKKLTKQRNIRKRLDYYFKLHEIKVNNINLVDFPVYQSQIDNFYSGWTNGFWSHIFLFIMFGVVLCWFGIWFLHRCH